MELIEKALTNRHLMNEQQINEVERAMKIEFTFFKDLSAVGVDIKKLMDHVRFMRSLDVKTIA